MNDTERLEEIRKYSNLPFKERDGRVAAGLLRDANKSIQYLLTRLEEAEKRHAELKYIAQSGFSDMSNLSDAFIHEKNIYKAENEQLRSLRDRMIEVVEQKRDEWQKKFDTHPDVNTADAYYQRQQAATVIITALKAVDAKGDEVEQR